jgi:hypothetical protein
MFLPIRIDYSGLPGVGMAFVAVTVPVSLLIEDSLPWKPTQVRGESWAVFLGHVSSLKFYLTQLTAHCKAIWSVQMFGALLASEVVHSWQKRVGRVEFGIAPLSIYTFCFKISRHLKMPLFHMLFPLQSVLPGACNPQTNPILSVSAFIKIHHWFCIVCRSGLQRKWFPNMCVCVFVREREREW